LLLLVRTDVGAVELNWMWLPTWIGMNTRLKMEMEEELAPMLAGKTMEEGNEVVLDYLCDKFPLTGLRDYLDGIKFVEET
jgi:hypothetical protein